MWLRDNKWVFLEQVGPAQGSFFGFGDVGDEFGFEGVEAGVFAAVDVLPGGVETRAVAGELDEFQQRIYAAVLVVEEGDEQAGFVVEIDDLVAGARVIDGAGEFAERDVVGAGEVVGDVAERVAAGLEVIAVEADAFEFGEAFIEPERDVAGDEEVEDEVGHLVREGRPLELEMGARGEEQFAAGAPATGPFLHFAGADEFAPDLRVEEDIDVAFAFEGILGDADVLLDEAVGPFGPRGELGDGEAGLGVEDEMVGLAVLPLDGLEVQGGVALTGDGFFAELVERQEFQVILARREGIFVVGLGQGLKAEEGGADEAGGHGEESSHGRLYRGGARRAPENSQTHMREIPCRHGGV